MNRRVKNFILAVFTLSIISLAGWLLWHELAKYSYQELKQGLTDISRDSLFTAVGLTVLSYWVLTFYDVLGIRYIGRTLSYTKTAFASFTSYVMSYNLGLSSIGGAALRFRLYSSWGFGTFEIAQLVAFCAIGFWSGFLVTCGIGFSVSRLEIAESFVFSPFELRLIGFFLLAIVAGYLVLCARRRTPITIRSWSFNLPTLSLALKQLLIGFTDMVVAAAVLYCLLPEGCPTFDIFLDIYLLSMFVGMISHVPGGIGVFDAAILLMLKPWIGAPDIVGALLAYRIIYFFIPLLLALILLAIHEASLWRKEIVEIIVRIRTILPVVMPPLVSLASLISGTMLLFTGATPSLHGRLEWLKTLLPLSVIEFSHFTGSLVGVLLLFLARGLYRRIDSAYVFSIFLILVGAVMACLKGEFGTGSLLFIFALMMLPCRDHFYRKASVFDQPLSLHWLLTYLVIIGFAVWLFSFSYKHVEYTNELWWNFALNKDASRSLRALTGAGILMGILMLARLMAPMHAETLLPTTDELKKVEAIVTASSATKANLALLGDKSFLLSPSGNSFIMYAVKGDSWIAMGDPVGDAAEFESLIWKFRELSDRHNDMPVFYEVSTEYLHLYLDAGFSMTKIGEEALVPLSDFSLEGSERKGLRATVRKLEREGCSFEIIPRESTTVFMPRLKAISDQWLSEKNSAEKSFSLGFFKESYLQHYNIAVIKVNGEIVAFCNLWEATNKKELSIDLMRSAADAPSGCMEYLFTKLMLWGAENEYQVFNLGVSPLAGLENHPLAPLWSRIGAHVYKHGEHFYNFQGLHDYKDKFNPTWRSCYLATLGGLHVPRILTNVATLVAGGWKEMLFR